MKSFRGRRWRIMFQKKVFIVIALLCFGGISGNRVRRHLVFTEGSRLFMSVDVRDNLFDYSSFFAHVYGIKMDWNLPSKLHSGAKKRIQRRDLYQGMENFLHQQNMNGTSCIRKFLCEASVFLPKSDDFLAQLYETIFSTDEDVRHVYKIYDSEQQCTEILNPAIQNECPLSLMSIFTGSESDFNIMVN